MSGRRSRDKGARREREVVARLQEAGFAAVKVSSMYRPGEDITLPLLGIDRPVEVKALANGFKTDYKWLQDRFLVVKIADKQEPLATLRLNDLLHILAAAEKRRAT